MRRAIAAGALAGLTLVTPALAEDQPAAPAAEAAAPAAPATAETVLATVNGQPITLPDEEEDALLEQAIARSAEDWAEDHAAEQDWRYQEYRDRQLMEKWEHSE